MAQSEIDSLLEQQLVGFNYDDDLSSDHQGLTDSHPFCWKNIMSNPKGNHGIYESRGSWYKTMKYEVLHSGGFLRLFTLRGRIYWNAQNESEHTTPDWKFHFSCDLHHIEAAWNSLTALFMDMKCEIGMKVTVHDYDSHLWSEGQRGREITVYIYRYHTSYRDYMQGAVPEHDHDVYLGPELHDTYNIPFWYTFITKAEERLTSIGAITRGVADGDLELPGCAFASLRNEAFIHVPKSVAYPVEKTIELAQHDSVKKHSKFDKSYTAAAVDDENKNENEAQLVLDEQANETMELNLASLEEPRVLAYPPNDHGWNAAKHPNPMLELLFFLREIEKIKEK